MNKNNKTKTKKRSAEEIYTLCRHFQARQEKGRDLTEAELGILADQIHRELSVHATHAVAEWRSDKSKKMA